MKNIVKLIAICSVLNFGCKTRKTNEAALVESTTEMESPAARIFSTKSTKIECRADPKDPQSATILSLEFKPFSPLSMPEKFRLIVAEAAIDHVDSDEARFETLNIESRTNGVQKMDARVALSAPQSATVDVHVNCDRDGSAKGSVDIDFQVDHIGAMEDAHYTDCTCLSK